MRHQRDRLYKSVDKAVNSDNGARLVSTPNWAQIVESIPNVLHRIAETGKLSCINAILKSKADIDVDRLDKEGTSPFLHAVRADEIDIVRAFLRHRDTRPIDVNRCLRDDEVRMSALMLSSASGSLELVHVLLATVGVDVNCRCPISGTTAFMCAVINGHIAVVRALLDDGRCHVNAQDGIDRFTALHYAMSLQQYDIVKVLLLSGRCDVRVKEEHGATAAELPTSPEVARLFERWMELQECRRIHSLKTKPDGMKYRYRLCTDFRQGQAIETTLHLKRL